MRISIGSDHAGFQYKTEIISMLTKQGYEVIDKGTYSPEPCDYPDFIRPAAQAVADGEADRGIVLGGSGNGEAIVANRIRGVRCSLAWNLESAILGRHHNDANVLSLGERMMDLPTALEIVTVWLNEPFDGGRHALRIAKIDPPV
jgi:ribose 5-phosphate isomerase B